MLNRFVKCHLTVSWQLIAVKKLGALKLALTVPGDTYICLHGAKVREKSKIHIRRL